MENSEVINGTQAYEAHERLLSATQNASLSAYVMGQALKEIRDNEYYVALGYDTFNSYFASPELGMKKSTVYRAIQLVESFPDYAAIEGIPVSKLTSVMPYLTEDNRGDMIALAQTLSLGDLLHQLSEHKRLLKEPESRPLPKIYECDVCHGAKGISWDQMCHCGIDPEVIPKIGEIIDRARA